MSIMFPRISSELLYKSEPEFTTGELVATEDCMTLLPQFIGQISLKNERFKQGHMIVEFVQIFPDQIFSFSISGIFCLF